MLQEIFMHEAVATIMSKIPILNDDSPTVEVAFLFR